MTFTDPSLVGPQDVTLVVHYKDGGGHAFTYLALESPEVWLPLESKGDPAPTRQSAFITGKVSGMSNPSNVFVKAVGPVASGFVNVATNGSFRLQVEGDLPAVVDLLAFEGTFGLFDVKAVGLRRGVAVPDGKQVSEQDISLDHPVNEQAKLTLNGADSYNQNFGSATLSFYQDNGYLFDSSKDSLDFDPPQFPSSVPAMALTAPFDTTRAMLRVQVGSSVELPAGSASARIPVENLSSITLSLPSPMTLTSPLLGTWQAPAQSSLSGLVFQWSMDAAAQLGEFSIVPSSDTLGQFGWTVMAPGSVSSFKPFKLPLDERTFTSPFSSGRYRISLSSRFDGTISHYADFFTQPPARDPFTQAWSTQLDGSIDLQ